MKKGKYTIYSIDPNGIPIRQEFQILKDIVATPFQIQGVSLLSLGSARMTPQNPGQPPHENLLTGEVIFNPKTTILIEGWNHHLLVTEYKCKYHWTNVIPIVATKPQIWQIVEANLNCEFDELLNVVQYEVPEIRAGYFNSGRYDIPRCDSVYLESDLPHDHPNYRPGHTHIERHQLELEARLNNKTPDYMQAILDSAVSPSSSSLLADNESYF